MALELVYSFAKTTITCVVLVSALLVLYIGLTRIQQSHEADMQLREAYQILTDTQEGLHAR